jgi:hypothetical protein
MPSHLGAAASSCSADCAPLLAPTGLGWLPYWRNSWNKFDFLLVCASLFDIICAYALSASIAKVFGVNKLLRLLRISRMFKLVKGIKVRRRACSRCPALPPACVHGCLGLSRAV